jgi:hypothetical protein
MNKNIAVALLAAAVAAGCTIGPDITPVGHDTYQISQSGYAVSQGGPSSNSGYSVVTEKATAAATQYCSSHHESTNILSTLGSAEISGGAFAGGATGGYVEVKVVFRCFPSQRAPASKAVIPQGATTGP